RNPPGRSGNTRRFPCRSSRVTASLASSTTAPHQPDPGSSTTSPGSAGTSGTGGRRRGPPARTSPYCLLRRSIRTAHHAIRPAKAAAREPHDEERTARGAEQFGYGATATVAPPTIQRRRHVRLWTEEGDRGGDRANQNAISVHEPFGNSVEPENDQGAYCDTRHVRS